MKISYKTFFNLIAITVIGTFSSVGVAKEIKPIKFNQGSVVGTASGQIPSGKQDTWYQFKAQKGQYAVINLLPKAGSPETANVGVLYMPSKQQNGVRVASCTKAVFLRMVNINYVLHAI